ncbi:MAG: hypothetical protein IBX47_09205, partial [Desulfuromonadales bacterium]|nr:hypothetical protein [Desulfuromonadales bacterium]
LGDFLAYLGSLDQIDSASIVDGVVVIVPVSGAEISGDLTLRLQTDEFKATEFSSNALSAAGSPAITEVAAEAAVMEINFAYINGDAPTSFSNYDIRLQVGSGLSVQATGSLSGVSDLTGLAAALNATESPFAGLVTFSAAENATDVLVATSIAEGESAQIGFIQASLFTDVGAGTGTSNQQSVFGADGIEAAPEAPASALLTEFAGVRLDDALEPAPYTYGVTVNGEIYSGNFDARSGATVADYIQNLLAANKELSPLSVVASVDLTDEGLLITSLASGPGVTVEVNAGGIQFTTLAEPREMVAQSVDKVELDGDVITLTGAATGPDQMQVSADDFAVEVIDEDASTVQVVDLLFSNSQFDSASTTPKGTVVSVTIDGVTSSLTIWDETPFQDGGVDFVNATGLGDTRSEAIITALKAVIVDDHIAPDTALGDVLQGFVNPTTGEFVESEAAGQGNTLRLIASEVGEDTLGNISDIVVSVQTPEGPLSAAVGAELVAPGEIVFKTINEDLAIYDKTAQPGSTNAQTGRDEGVLVFNDPTSNESANGADYDFVIGSVQNGVIEGEDAAYLYSEYAIADYPGDSSNTILITELAGFVVQGQRGAGAYRLADGNYDITIVVNGESRTLTLEVDPLSLDSDSGGIRLSDWVNMVQRAIDPFTSIASVSLTADGLKIEPNNSNTISISDVTPLKLQFIGEFSGLDVDNEVREGVAPDQFEDQAWTNPGDVTELANTGESINADFRGDAPLTGADAGVGQDFVNPDGSRTDLDTGDGDATFFGDAAIIGDDGDGYNGEGVKQSVTNPDSGYDAIGQSPALNNDSDNTGDDSLFGSDPGFYDDQGLNTTWLNGGTPDAENDQLYAPGEPGNPDQQVELGDGSSDNDGGVSGESADSLAASDEEDDFTVEKDRDGFAAFDWDDSVTVVLNSHSSDADVVNNFQVNNDLIALEADLWSSTESGGKIELVASSNQGSGGNSYSGFDLSSYEFGLVFASDNQGAISSVGVGQLEDADAVAALLGEVFNFSADNNDVLNTTVFAITAADDDSVTAIWAHQQSSTDDNTIDSAELYKLALVNTVGGEFGVGNFAGVNDILSSEQQ